MLSFNKKYLIAAFLIFAIEVLIALFVNDNFIRPCLGDVLVVIFIYCFLRAFLNLPVWIIALFVMIFSFTIEILQYFNIIEKLGLENSKIARVVIGTSFSWLDFVFYIVGILIVIVAEKVHTIKKPLNT